MKIFRLAENVPDIYCRQSRDFQLLCNSFDLIQNSIRNEVNSMCLVSDTSSCPDTLLPYLQTKLGFFTDQKIDSDKLRIILQAFPHIVRNKGSRNGIILAIRTFLKCIHRAEIVHLDIHNAPLTGSGERDYFITIGMNGELTDVSILNELLKYVVPTGYDVQYYFFNDTEALTTVKPSDSIRIFFIKTTGEEGKSELDNSKLVRTDESYAGSRVWELDSYAEEPSEEITAEDKRLFNIIGTTRVVPRREEG